MDEVRALLLEVPLFAGLDEATLSVVAARVRRRRFRRGAVLFHQGEVADALHVLTAGMVKIALITEDGEEVVLGLAGPGACLGEVAVLDGAPRSATVTAAEPSETLALARPDLSEALRESHALALALIGTLAARLRRADARLEDAYFSDLDTRLARRLLQLAEDHGHATAAGIEVPLPLTQAELASMLGAGRPRVNGLLGAYQDAGLIKLDRGSLIVLQPDALRRRAGRY